MFYFLHFGASCPTVYVRTLTRTPPEIRNNLLPQSSPSWGRCSAKRAEGVLRAALVMTGFRRTLCWATCLLTKTPPEKRYHYLHAEFLQTTLVYKTGLAETNGRGSALGWQVKQSDLYQLHWAGRQTRSHRQGLVGCVDLVLLQTCQLVGQKRTLRAR